jgi:hypothetical protein
MANKMSEFEKRLGSARLPVVPPDLFRQIVARLPKNWIETSAFESAAGTALRAISGSPVFAPVVRLFKIANLDHEIPWHWPILLGLIVWATSEGSRGPGATKKWTSKKMNELRNDLASLKSTKDKSLMAKHLQKKFPDKYGKLKHDYFRKIVARALLEEASSSLLVAMRPASNPKMNTADAINGFVTDIKKEIETEKALLAWPNTNRKEEEKEEKEGKEGKEQKEEKDEGSSSDQP